MLSLEVVARGEGEGGVCRDRVTLGLAQERQAQIEVGTHSKSWVALCAYLTLYMSSCATPNTGGVGRWLHAEGRDDHRRSPL